MKLLSLFILVPLLLIFQSGETELSPYYKRVDEFLFNENRYDIELLESSTYGEYVLYYYFDRVTQISQFAVFNRFSQQHIPVGRDENGNLILQNYQSAKLSKNGHFVLFFGVKISGTTDVYLQDLSNNTIYPIVVNDDQHRGHGEALDVSSDGRYVLYGYSDEYSIDDPSQQCPGNPKYCGQIFLLDRVYNSIETISISPDKTWGDNHSSRALMSADARYIVFSSFANNLVSGDTNDGVDIFLRDRKTGTTKRINLKSNGDQAMYPHPDNRFEISQNGQYIIYEHNEALIDTIDQEYGIYKYDRVTGKNEFISVSTTEIPAIAFLRGISNDGRYVFFTSSLVSVLTDNPDYYNNIEATCTMCSGFLFMRDTAEGSTIPINDPVSMVNDQTLLPSSATMSGNGEFVIYLFDARLRYAERNNQD